MPRLGTLITASLLIWLLASCTPASTPIPTHAPVSTATPTPTSVAGIRPDRPPSAIETTAPRLAAEFQEDKTAAAERYNGRYVVVKGTAVKAGATNDGGLLLVLEGTELTSVFCAAPRGLLTHRELTNRLPREGLAVLVSGWVSILEAEGNVLIVDCATLKTGTEVSRTVTKIPAMGNVFQGWGMFWGWMAFTIVGYLLPLRRWRTTSPWLLVPFLILHTGAVATLYAFLGSLILPYYNTSGAGYLASWPLVLFMNPS